MALRRGAWPSLPLLAPWSFLWQPKASTRTPLTVSHNLFQFSLALPISVTLTVPPILFGLWESILRAVPKKKTSHRKKRQRFMAGNSMKDLSSLNKCSACGNVKRAHLLCPYCVKEIQKLWKEKLSQGEDTSKIGIWRKGSPERRLTILFEAHITDIFSLAVTPAYLLSASGSSSIKIYSTTEPDFPLLQTLEKAHSLGCHHLVASGDGLVAASIGFGGEAIIWSLQGGKWVEDGRVVDGNQAGEIWAIALSADGQYLASTSIDGRINVWDNLAKRTKIREFETNKNFGMSIDLSRNGRFTASGHENGGIYIFNNDTGRLFHSLQGLAKPVRAVAFSPGGTLLAAAGDYKVIALYDALSGEQVANLSGHGAWICSLDWSNDGEYLLSGAFDGKAKVWSVNQRTCVATHTETVKTLWSVKWLPKAGRNGGFVTAGASRNISVYREAVGG